SISVNAGVWSALRLRGCASVMEESMRYPRWASSLTLCLILAGSSIRAQELSPSSENEAPLLSIRLGLPRPLQEPGLLPDLSERSEPAAASSIRLGRPRSIMDSPALVPADSPPRRLFCLSPVDPPDSAVVQAAWHSEAVQPSPRSIGLACPA